MKIVAYWMKIGDDGCSHPRNNGVRQREGGDDHHHGFERNAGQDVKRWLPPAYSCTVTAIN